MNTPRLIGLDWGTSSLRAYLLGGNGTILEARSADSGIMRVKDGAYARALDAACGDWLATYPALPLLLSGMIGSKQGWLEAPYCACPADAHAISESLAPLELPDTRSAHIVPGLSTTGASGVPDVMRGEETQIIGALPATGSHLAVLPGTHSKWAWVEHGMVRSFASFMTGEVYAALTGHTILGRMMRADAPHDTAAFARGAAYGREAPEALLSRVFSARTLGLFGQLGEAALPSYLSGLLIGSEIGGAMRMTPHAGMVTILGNPNLTQRYREAFGLAGIPTQAGPPDCAALGLWRIALAAGLVAAD
jgi:2-dehydro-3-deoxygalactonokinase